MFVSPSRAESLAGPKCEMCTMEPRIARRDDQRQLPLWLEMDGWDGWDGFASGLKLSRFPCSKIANVFHCILHEQLLKCRSLISHMFISIAITVRVIPSKREGGGIALDLPRFNLWLKPRSCKGRYCLFIFSMMFGCFKLVYLPTHISITLGLIFKLFSYIYCIDLYSV